MAWDASRGFSLWNDLHTSEYRNGTFWQVASWKPFRDRHCGFSIGCLLSDVSLLTMNPRFGAIFHAEIVSQIALRVSIASHHSPSLLRFRSSSPRIAVAKRPAAGNRQRTRVRAPAPGSRHWATCGDALRPFDAGEPVSRNAILWKAARRGQVCGGQWTLSPAIVPASLQGGPLDVAHLRR